MNGWRDGKRPYASDITNQLNPTPSLITGSWRGGRSDNWRRRYRYLHACLPACLTRNGRALMSWQPFSGSLVLFLHLNLYYKIVDWSGGDDSDLCTATLYDSWSPPIPHPRLDRCLLQLHSLYEVGNSRTITIPSHKLPFPIFCSPPSPPNSDWKSSQDPIFRARGERFAPTDRQVNTVQTACNFVWDTLVPLGLNLQ